MGTDSVPVEAGDVVVVLAWSNVATTMHGTINFKRKLEPGDKSPAVVNIATPDFATGSSRAVTSATVTMPYDGEITGVSTVGVSGGATQRGQLFVQMVLTRQGTNVTVVQTLFQGYVYTGQVGALGQIVEPGPAGGHGNIRGLATADPAAAAEIALQAAPTGTIWRLEAISVQLVQGITQTPLPTVKIQDQNGIVIAQIPITTTAISASSTAQLTWAIGQVQSSFTAIVGDEFHTAPLPNLFLFAGGGWSTVTDGIGANTNYGAAEYQIEEWVMPN